MKVKLITIGKTKQDFIRAGIKEYENKLKCFIQFELVEIPDIKKGKSFDEVSLKKAEAELIMNKVGDDKLILLDENGKQMNSRAFAKAVEQKQHLGSKSLCFAVGGAYGFSEEMKSKFQSVSLSKMTFSHQVIRLIFMEQLYRAFSIIHGFPYHND